MHAIIYSRGSLDRSKQENTHEVQISKCMEWIAKEKLTLKGVFSEAISGGADLDKRKVLNTAINELSKGDVLVVTKRDRFGRSVPEVRKAEMQIEARGARVYSLELGFNDTINSNFQNGITDLMNETERARISQRTRDVMQHLKSEGRFTGRAPVGSSVRIGDDGKKYLTDNESEQIALAQVRAWKEAGHTQTEIIKLCETHNIESREGRPPSQATISRWTRGVEAPEKIKKGKKVNTEGRKAKRRLEDIHTGLLALINSLLCQGFSHSKIKDEVERAGFRTSKGRPFAKSQITTIIARNTPH